MQTHTRLASRIAIALFLLVLVAATPFRMRYVEVIQSGGGDSVLYKIDGDTFRVSSSLYYKLPSNYWNSAKIIQVIGDSTNDVRTVATFPTSRISVPETGTATYDALDDFMNIQLSSGRLTGMVITANSPADGTIDVSAGTGMIKTTNAVAGTMTFFDYAGGNVALTDNALNYLYMDYNSGTPTVSATTDRTTIHEYDQFTIGRAYRQGTDVDIASSGVNIYNEYRRIHNRLVKMYGFQNASGSQISESGTRGLSVTAGVWYIGNTEIATAPATGATFTYYYYNGSAWVSGNATQISNTQYNNVASGLASISVNRYVNAWIYLCPEGDLYWVYGQNQYVSLASAQAQQAPTALPNYVSTNCRLIARVVVQNGTTNFVTIDNALLKPIMSGTATSHNNLSGLQGGAISDYYHLRGNQLDSIETRLYDSTYTIDEADVLFVPFINSPYDVDLGGKQLSASYVMADTSDIGTLYFSGDSIRNGSGAAWAVPLTSGRLALEGDVSGKIAYSDTILLIPTKWFLHKALTDSTAAIRSDMLTSETDPHWYADSTNYWTKAMAATRFSPYYFWLFNGELYTSYKTHIAQLVSDTIHAVKVHADTLQSPTAIIDTLTINQAIKDLDGIVSYLPQMGGILLAQGDSTLYATQFDISGKVDKTTTVNGQPLSGNVSVGTVTSVATGNGLSGGTITTTGTITADTSILATKNYTNQRILKTEKGAAYGVANLDENAKIPISLIPDALIGAVNWQGTWSALTNTPTIPVAATANKGWYYTASDSGVYAGLTYKLGDWIISNGSAWERLQNNHAVTSVAGKLGDVVLTASDVDAVPYENAVRDINIGGKELMASKVTGDTIDTGTLYNSGRTIQDGSGNTATFQASSGTVAWTTDIPAPVDETDPIWTGDSTRYAAKAWVNAKGYLTAEVDGSTTNEIQDLSGSGASVSGYTISLSGDATAVTLPNETDPEWIGDSARYAAKAWVEAKQYLTTESDPVWLSDSSDYYKKGVADTRFSPYYFSLSGQTVSNNYTTVNSDTADFGELYLSGKIQNGSGEEWTMPASTGTLALTSQIPSPVDISGKVDKVAGKALSSNDYTDADSTKMLGIAAGAEVNVNADWNAGSGDAQILNKPTIPDVSGFVPFTGAGSDLDMGTHYVKADSGRFRTVSVDTLRVTDVIEDNDGTNFYLPQAGGTLALDSDIPAPIDTTHFWSSYNDGSGSGLDADKLDGVEGSGYMTTPVVVADLDTATADRRVFGAYNGVHNPLPTDDYFTGSTYSIQGNAYYESQLGFTLWGRLFKRYKAGAAWSGWSEIYDSGNFLAGTHYQAPITNPITGTGTANYLPKFTGTGTIGNSLVYDNGTNVGIGYLAGTEINNNKLAVNGSVFANGAVKTYGAFGSIIGYRSFGSNFVMDTNGGLSTVDTHANYGYSGIVASWGSIDFVADAVATTAGATITPAVRARITGDGHLNLISGQYQSNGSQIFTAPWTSGTSGALGYLPIGQGITSAPVWTSPSSINLSAFNNDLTFQEFSAGLITTDSLETDSLYLSGSHLIAANRTYTFPAKSGTFAMTSDIVAQVYPSAGIAVSTGSAWGASISDASANWNTAYGWGNHANAGYLTSASLSGYVTYTGGTTDLNLSSNAITAAKVTTDTLDLSGQMYLTNKYFESAAGGYKWTFPDSSGHVALVSNLHSPVTIGTANGLSVLGQALSMATASTNTTGALTDTDWDTFNGKQAALVSGTNIKTINSKTLLGSGDLAVQATLVNQSNIKSINGTTLLGSGDLTVTASIPFAFDLTDLDAGTQIDFAVNRVFTKTVAGGGTTTFTATNLAPNREITLVITTTSGSQTLAFTGGVGASIPTSTAATKTVIILKAISATEYVCTFTDEY